MLSALANATDGPRCLPHLLPLLRDATKKGETDDAINILESILYDVKSKNLSDTIENSGLATNSVILYQFQGFSKRLQQIEEKLDKKSTSLDCKPPPEQLAYPDPLQIDCAELHEEMEFDVYGKIFGVIPKLEQKNPDSSLAPMKSSFQTVVMLRTSSDIFSRNKKVFLYPLPIVWNERSPPSADGVVTSIKGYSENVKFEGEGNVRQVGLCLHSTDLKKDHFVYVNYDEMRAEVTTTYFQKSDDFGSYRDSLHQFVLEVAGSLFEDVEYQADPVYLESLKNRDRLTSKGVAQSSQETEFDQLCDADSIVRLLTNMILFGKMKCTVPPDNYSRLEKGDPVKYNSYPSNTWPSRYLSLPFYFTKHSELVASLTTHNPL